MSASDYGSERSYSDHGYDDCPDSGYSHHDDYDDYDQDSYDHRDHGHKGHGKKGGCKLSPWAAYLIWLIIFLVLLWILRAAGIRWFSNVVFSLVVSTIILSCIYPFKTNRHGKWEFCGADALYSLIVFVTVVLVIVWFIWKVFTDRECQGYSENHGHHENHGLHHMEEGVASPVTDMNSPPAVLPVQ